MEEGREPISGDTVIPFDVAGIDEAAESFTAARNASCEPAGYLRYISICTTAMHVFTRPLLALSSHAQSLGILIRKRSHVPHFIFRKDAKHSYIRFRALSLGVSNAVLSIFPSELQWDLELAYVLHLLVSLLAVPIDGFIPALVYNPKIFFGLFQIYDRITYGLRSAGSRYTSTEKWDHSRLLTASYYLPFILIILHFLFWAMAAIRIAKFIPKRFCKVVTEADFWLRSGRTIFSVPFILLMMLLPSLIQIIFIRRDFEVIRSVPDTMARMRWSDMGQLWKDPLEDQLWII
jgi:hypothetical protein